MGFVRIRNVLLFSLFLLSAIAFLDRTNVSIAGPQISREYGLDNVHLGWVFSAFLIGYALFQVPAGWLAVRFGPQRTMAAGVLWWGVFTALTAAVSAKLSYAMLLLIAIRFGLGIGEAVVYPAANQFVARWIPQRERGRANGWIFAGVGAGAGLTPPALAAIIHAYGWRTSFWVCAVVGTCAGIGWYVLSRDTPERHPWVSWVELAEIGRGSARRAVDAQRPKLRWQLLVKSRSLRLLALAYFCFGYVAWIFFSWFYLYMAQARGVDLRSSVFYAMLPFLAMTICCLLGGAVNDSIANRYGVWWGRCGIGVLSMGITAVLLAVGSVASDARTAGWVLAAGAGALYLSQSGFWSATADIGGEHAGVVAGVMNFGAQVGGAVTASLTPWIAAHSSWTAAFVTAAVLAMVGAVAWGFVNPLESIAPAEDQQLTREDTALYGTR